MQEFPNGFDFAFNGTLDETAVRALLTLDFARAGRNIALVGHSGTGKTTIATAVEAKATAAGLSVEKLYSPSGNGDYGDAQRICEATLADILFVDEFDRWLEYHCEFMLMVLVFRGRRKLPTVVTISAGTLERRFTSKTSLPGSFATGPFEAFGDATTVARAYNRLGLWLDAQELHPGGGIFDRIDVPTALGARSLVDLYGIYPVEWLQSAARSTLSMPTRMQPWTVLNAGTRSYRPVLKARQRSEG